MRAILETLRNPENNRGIQLL